MAWLRALSGRLFHHCQHQLIQIHCIFHNGFSPSTGPSRALTAAGRQCKGCLRHQRRQWLLAANYRRCRRCRLKVRRALRRLQASHGVGASDPETRKRIDKMAEYILRNGPSFESMTQQKQKVETRSSALVLVVTRRFRVILSSASCSPRIRSTATTDGPSIA